MRPFRSDRHAGLTPTQSAPARSAPARSSPARREATGPPAPGAPHSARTLLALQRAAGNRAVTGLAGRMPPGNVTVQRKPTKVEDATDRSVNWYADDRNPTIRFVEMRSSDRSDTRRYFRIDGVVYEYDDANDQYVNAKDNDRLWDPTTGRVIERLHTYPIEYYECQQRGILRYHGGLYQPMDLLENFRAGDLLYGKETERKLLRSFARDRAEDMNTTADEYNREVVPSRKALDPDQMSDEAHDYHRYLRSQGPGSRDIVDVGSGLSRETRLKRSCVALIDYKTGQGYWIHFELQGVNLANEPQYYTETELRFILENRNFLNMQNIKFYRDGTLVPTQQVIDDHELLVDEILDKGRVVGGPGPARIVTDLLLESYDRPPNRNDPPGQHQASGPGQSSGAPYVSPGNRFVTPNTPPALPAPPHLGGFTQVPTGARITGTRQQLWQRYQPADLLPRVLFTDTIVTWGGVTWRCDQVVLDETGEDVITLRRLS